MKEQLKELCGETKELMYDKKIKLLNLELAIDEIGSPIIIFQDWTEKEKSKDLFRLHIKEAIELKAIIENLGNDYLWLKIDELIQNNNLIFNHKVKSNPYVDKDIQCREDECSK